MIRRVNLIIGEIKLKEIFKTAVETAVVVFVAIFSLGVANGVNGEGTYSLTNNPVYNKINGWGESVGKQFRPTTLEEEEGENLENPENLRLSTN